MILPDNHRSRKEKAKSSLDKIIMQLSEYADRSVGTRPIPRGRPGHESMRIRSLLSSLILLPQQVFAAAWMCPWSGRRSCPF